MKRVIDANAPRGDNGKLRCVLCQVTMPSPQVAQTHFSGKKHQKKLAALKTAEQTQEEILNDSVCDLTSPGRFDCRRGVKEVFWNAAAALEVVPMLISYPNLTQTGVIGTDVSLTRAIKKAQRLPEVCSSSSSPSAPSAPSYQPTVAAFQCNVCSITVTSMTQLTQHQSGLKHLKRVQKESREKSCRGEI